ncbi:MAG: sialate O-acetylesterase [Verrucomicrobiota bacterium]
MKLPACLFLLVLSLCPVAAAPVKVFILAGQSNMEGQAVVDLKGKDYNEGRGTLTTLLADPAKAAGLQHLRNPDGSWRVRDDVWVRYQREEKPLLAGPLTFGFSVYGDVHHFGPELQFGHVMGDFFPEPVLLIKTAWGGKSLYRDFRPPSSGGAVGPYYTLMIAQVREALAKMEKEFPATQGLGHELAGFVWYQGWNDGVDPKNAVPEYEQNLVHLIHDVRRELQAPELPVVIGELTGAWVQAPPEWEQLRAAQAAAAARPEFAGNVVFVPTRDFVRKPEDSPNPGHGHHEFGNAETYFLVGDALGKAMTTLLSGRLSLASPLDYQVIQRNHRNTGTITISGKSQGGVIEARIGPGGDWKHLDAETGNGTFHTTMEAAAGGWHRLDVRSLKEGKVTGKASVAHVGIGEVFVVAGQSNSANHGEEKQTTKTGRVAAFDGQGWRLANDPQPGASGGGGSFMPPLGDALVRQLDVPVGFIACGIGATSVREWLPQGTVFPYPPTIESRVQKRPDGSWESKGEAFESFVARLKQAGPLGFRAVLWHQGESDANQQDPTRTLAGNLYRAYLEKLIRDSRRETGWEAPWFVAQASYHVPGDESSPEIRAAQASLWKDGIALEGPDSDALKGALRDSNGQGVHFSGEGLRGHAARWAEKITPWLMEQLK